MRVIVVGCGRIGAALARHLSLHGNHVRIIDVDAKAFKRLGTAFKGETVVGVGFDREVLLKAGIERADGLAAVTSSDDANVVIARLAKGVFNVPRVVARVYDPREAEIYRRLGLQIISPTSVSTHLLADLLTFSQLDRIATLGNGEVDIVQVEAPVLLVGRLVNSLTAPGEIEIVAITRGGRTFLPIGETVFAEGDVVHLALLAASADRLKSLLGLA